MREQDGLNGMGEAGKSAKELYEEAIREEDWDACFDRTKKEPSKEEHVKHSDEPDGPEEGMPAKGVTSPEQPTETEIQEHCLTHIPYRHWCIHCVRANAINDAHNDVSEERRAEEMAHNATTT